MASQDHHQMHGWSKMPLFPKHWELLVTPRAPTSPWCSAWSTVTCMLMRVYMRCVLRRRCIIFIILSIFHTVAMCGLRVYGHNKMREAKWARVRPEPDLWQQTKMARAWPEWTHSINYILKYIKIDNNIHSSTVFFTVFWSNKFSFGDCKTFNKIRK